MKTITTTLAALALSVAGMAIGSQAMMSNKSNPMVGGMAMMANRNIVQNALDSKDHTTLVAAVKAAGLVDTLMSKGPFTVFAPTNAAFNMLPEGTVDKLLMAENKKMLTDVLTYHVVAGKIDGKELKKRINAGGGKAMLKTVNGETLWAMMNGPMNVVLKDAKGNWASISTYDVYQSNGVIHVIDHVLMP